MTEEKLFPKEFTQCPNCGSEQRVAKMVCDDLITNERASKNLKGWMLHTTSILAPDKPHFSAPTVQAAFDICYDCGTFYCIAVDMRMTMVQAGKQPPPMDFGSPGNN